MKRALLTVHKFFPAHKAGTEVLALKVAQELQRRDYEVLVVTANPPDSDARYKAGPQTLDYEYEGIRVHSIEEALRLKNNSYTSEYYNPAVGEHFASVLDSFAPHLVHMFHVQNLSGSIINETVARHKPLVLSATDFWFICPVVQLKRPDGSICTGPTPFALNCLSCYTPQLFPEFNEFDDALRAKYPGLCNPLSQLPEPLSNMGKAALYAAYNMSKIPRAAQATIKRPEFLKHTANKASAITVATRLMQNLLVKNGIRADLINHVPFGIDTAPLTTFQEKGPSQELRIGFIGTIYEHKGVDLLIKAFFNLLDDAPNDCNLKIYGDTNQFPQYTKQLKDLLKTEPAKSERITFEGTFPNSRLGYYLSKLDVLVVPSRWYENTPLVIQSAFATKTPVIATNLGGMSELVHHNENGLLFELNNEQSLLEQLRRLIKEPGLLKKLTANIKPERTVSDMVDQLETIYDKIGVNGPYKKYSEVRHAQLN